MSRSLSVAVGVVLLLVGLLWTGQGLGWVGGSPMTGVTLWAVVGPVVALAGIALLVTAARRGPGEGR